MTATQSRTAPVRRGAPAAEPARTRPDLRVVGQPMRRRRSGAAAAATVVLLFAILFLNAVFHSVLVSGQVRLDHVNQQVNRAEALNQQRRLQAARMESPDRIVEAATLAGMIVPDEVHWVMPEGVDGGAVAATSQRAMPSAPADSTDGPDTATDERANDGTPSDDTSTVPERR